MNEIFMFHSAHGVLLQENFFDMRSKITVLNGITLPQDLDEEISQGKEIEIIIKTNSIVGDGVFTSKHTEDEYFEGDFESKYKNYLKFVAVVQNDYLRIIGVFLYNPISDEWINFSGSLDTTNMYINKMFSIPNIEYDYNDPDAFQTGYLRLMKTSEGYESVGRWLTPDRSDVKLYDAQKREQNLVERGTYGNEDQFVYLFSHILENEELADKFLSPEPLRITIFNSACLYFGVDIRNAAELFPTWTAIWKHEIETVLLNEIKTTKDEIKELSKDYPVTVKMFDDTLKSFRKTYKDLSRKWGKDNDLGDLYDLVQEEKEKREEKYMTRPANDKGRMKSVNFMVELEDSLHELMALDTEKGEIEDNLESKRQDSEKYKAKKLEYDLLKKLDFPITFKGKRDRKKTSKLDPVFTRPASISKRKGKSRSTKKSRGKGKNDDLFPIVESV